MTTIYCIPHAGGTERAFLGLRKVIPQLVPLAIAGKGRRAREPRQPDIQQLAAELANGIDTTQPYALLGNSLGGLIAYELANTLALQGKRPPEVLVTSATRPPHRVIRERYAPLLALSDDSLLDTLADAVPQSVRHSPMRHLFTPTLRADLALAANYVPSCATLDIGVRVWFGTEDAETPAELLTEWSRYTTAGCRLSPFSGGHFFLHTSPDATTALQELTRIAVDFSG